MFTFSQPVTPAVKNYLEAQLSLLGDISNKLFETAQQVNALNIRVAQTLADESVAGVRQVLEARDPYEALTVAIRHVQPTAERWRAYEQHLTHIAAGTQAELVKAAGAHAPETTRAAAALAEEMEQQAQQMTEAAEKTVQSGVGAMEKMPGGMAGAKRTNGPGRNGRRGT